MDLRGYLAILRRHLVFIVLTTLIGLGVAAVAYALTPPTFATTVDFYVSTPLPEGANAQSAGQFAQGRVNTYVKLLTSEELARRVIAETGVDLTPAEVVRRMRGDADVSTVLVRATATDRSPERSFLIGRGVALTFGKMVDQLDNAGRKTEVVVINVVSGPTLRPTPVSPELRTYLAIGLAAGLLLGVAYAFVREFLDTSIRTAAEATRITQVPVLGSIPYDPAVRKSPLIIGEESLSVRAEAYRKLRTNLQFIDAAQNADVIMITSSIPKEGKSVTSINLALSLVELGRRTLLIEGDMRQPQASAYLDVENQVGLSNVLAGQAEVFDVIQPWGRDGLAVLPSGSIPPNPSELLGSGAMESLVRRLRERFDHIVIDTPPVVPVTDAVVASRHADVILMVVQMGRTGRSLVSNAAGALHAVDAPLVGTVLSMVKPEGEQRYYGAAYYRSDESRPLETTPPAN